MAYAFLWGLVFVIAIKRKNWVNFLLALPFHSSNISTGQGGVEWCGGLERDSLKLPKVLHVVFIIQVSAPPPSFPPPNLSGQCSNAKLRCACENHGSSFFLLSRTDFISRQHDPCGWLRPLCPGTGLPNLAFSGPLKKIWPFLKIGWPRNILEFIK